MQHFHKDSMNEYLKAACFLIKLLRKIIIFGKGCAVLFFFRPPSPSAA